MLVNRVWTSIYCSQSLPSTSLSLPPARLQCSCYAIRIPTKLRTSIWSRLDDPFRMVKSRVPHWNVVGSSCADPQSPCVSLSAIDRVLFQRYLSTKKPKSWCKNRKRYLFMSVFRQIFSKFYSLSKNHMGDRQGSSHLTFQVTKRFGVLLRRVYA